ncbi:MAG: pimeloyl-ACP methyl ester carboxylesterase [Cognaticolwellia sp.]|jgi:pimeloyl-ACP methyl ester carboxylesterase
MKNIVFSHSNGFSLKTYNYFLEQLKPNRITGLDNIVTVENWQTWKDFIPKYIQHIEENYTEPVIGIGHSLGAVVTFFAAEQRPDLFSKIILIEPPIFSANTRRLIWFLTKIGLADKFSPAGKAFQRRDNFESREVAYKALRNRGIFKRFDENCFKDYIQYGFQEIENGITLDYPKALEGKIFQNPPFFFKHPNLAIPTHFIHSKYYKTLSEKDIRWWKKSFQYIHFHEFDGGHMMPLEKPKVFSDFLKSLL